MCLQKKLTNMGFQCLSAKDRDLFYRYYDQMNGYWGSALCFADMVAWSDSFAIYHKTVGRYMLMLAYDTEKKRWVMLPFLGHYDQESVNEAFFETEEYVKELEVPLILMEAAEWMKTYYEGIPEVKWEVINDRGLCDYLYAAEDFYRHAIDGKDTRYNRKYFQRKYQTTTELLTPGHLDACTDFLERSWCAVHQCEECQYGCLKKTAASVITNINDLDADGIVIFTEGRVIAYSIVSCHNGLGFFEFKKTERGFRGINEYIHKECFERFLQEARVINYSEDMGLEGLRKYKTKLAPYTLAPRYELRKQ